MKIAFVGKGGSGKSTVSGLFVRHLIETKQKIIAVDADINQHFASMIGAKFDSEKALDKHIVAIRRHLTGSNARIAATKTMIKTSPPGKGSNVVTIHANDTILRQYATKFAPSSYFLHVGTYQDDGIGMSCYHSSLSILENVLSHSYINQDDEWVVVDMVAGTDAFSGPLHAMFDVIFMIAEPTVESVTVVKQFMQLAKSAGVADRVKIIANKIEDTDDLAYIADETGCSPVAHIAYDPALRKQRRNGGIVQVHGAGAEAMRQITTVARDNALEADVHLHNLQALHTEFAKQQFTIDKYGDTLGHIDPVFSFGKGGKA